MTPLEKGQLWVMRIRATITTLVIMAGALVPELIIRDETNVPFGLVITPVGLIGLFVIFFMIGRRYCAWGYRHEPDELMLRHGLMTRIETVVPLFRVQHIDIGQGPLERLFGVNRLILHTAGTQHSRVELPGLSRETAEQLRDEIRARVGREAP